MVNRLVDVICLMIGGLLAIVGCAVYGQLPTMEAAEALELGRAMSLGVVVLSVAGVVNTAWALVRGDNT